MEEWYRHGEVILTCSRLNDAIRSEDGFHSQVNYDSRIRPDYQDMEPMTVKIQMERDYVERLVEYQREHPLLQTLRLG